MIHAMNATEAKPAIYYCLLLLFQVVKGYHLLSFRPFSPLHFSRTVFSVFEHASTLLLRTLLRDRRPCRMTPLPTSSLAMVANPPSRARGLQLSRAVATVVVVAARRAYPQLGVVFYPFGEVLFVLLGRLRAPVAELREVGEGGVLCGAAARGAGEAGGVEACVVALGAPWLAVVEVERGRRLEEVGDSVATLRRVSFYE